MSNIKVYAVSGLVRTSTPVLCQDGVNVYPYELCKFYFRFLDDALAYARIYCSDFPWAVLDYDGSVVANSEEDGV